jgi:hypothetical protein
VGALSSAANWRLDIVLHPDSYYVNVHNVESELWWRKRRLVCAEPWCPRRTFTQPSTAVQPRARVTERLREQLATAIAS